MTTRPSIPKALRETLLFGVAGKAPLHAAAVRAEASGEDALAMDLRLAAFEAAPCDLDAHRLAAPHIAGTALRPQVGEAREPRSVGYYQRLLQRREGEKLLDYLAARLAEEPDSSFWQSQAWHFGRFAGRADWLENALLPSLLLPGENPVAALLRAECAFLREDWESAVHLGDAVATWGGKPLPWARPLLLAAEARLRMGMRDEALSLFVQALSRRAWDARLWAKVHDVATGLENDIRPLPGSLAVCCYTWNKAADLSATLDALFAALSAVPAGEGPLPLLVLLDNGSTDTTPDVAAKAASVLGGRFMHVRLPVNVGAAAARNWLAALPEVRARDFLLYLDDDALLPKDALGRFGSAVAAAPGAFVWGCRVVDAAAPWIVQHADLHLSPGEGGEAFRFSTAHVHEPDWGGLAYLRSCASVTGCCHLFRTGELLEGGGFDIRLSPSQYDDLERDIRRAAAGRLAWCQGHLAVRHLKSEGGAAKTDRTAEAGARGNRIKLEAMHAEEEIVRIRDMDLDALERDLGAKTERLAGILKEKGMTR